MPPGAMVPVFGQVSHLGERPAIIFMVTAGHRFVPRSYFCPRFFSFIFFLTSSFRTACILCLGRGEKIYLARRFSVLGVLACILTLSLGLASRFPSCLERVSSAFRKFLKPHNTVVDEIFALGIGFNAVIVFLEGMENLIDTHFTLKQNSHNTKYRP
jgi:hypothetical protein